MYRGFFIACLFAYFAVPDRAIADCRGGQGGGRLRERFHLFDRGGGCQSQQAGCQGATAGCQGHQGGGRFIFRQRTVHKGYSSAPVKAPANPPAPMPKKASQAENSSQTALVLFEAPKVADGQDMLSAVNSARQQRGLRPFVRDDGLLRAALDCARFRARHRIAGHTANDFQFLPAGTVATATGAGALPPSFGFAACCVGDNYTYAGCATVVGDDGLWYNSVFVR